MDEKRSEIIRVHKREIEVPVATRIDELLDIIGGLGISSIDADVFEILLNRAIKQLFISLPYGQKNYGSDNPEIGSIWLCRFYNRTQQAVIPNCTNIQFNPSELYREKNMESSIQRVVGKVNLRQGDYSLQWDIPKILVPDTETVMGYLGLEKKVIQ
jgi:hypothetical protein